MARVDWARIPRAGFLKTHEIYEGEIKMASVLCFRLVAMCRSVVNWRKIAFSSTCRNIASGNVFQGKCFSLLPASADNKRQQNEDRGKFYTSPYALVLSGSICTALWGSIHAECVGADSPGKENDIPCSSEKKVHDKMPTKLVRDASGRFSSVQKIQNNNNKKVLPMNLPNSRTTVKGKWHYESDDEEQDQVCFKRKTRSLLVRVSLFCLHLCRFSLTTPHPSRNICSWNKTMRKF